MAIEIKRVTLFCIVRFGQRSDKYATLYRLRILPFAINLLLASLLLTICRKRRLNSLVETERTGYGDRRQFDVAFERDKPENDCVQACPLFLLPSAPVAIGQSLPCPWLSIKVAFIHTPTRHVPNMERNFFILVLLSPPDPNASSLQIF